MVEDNTLYLKVPLEYTKENIEARYSDLLRSAIIVASEGEIQNYEIIIVEKKGAPSVLDSVKYKEDSTLNKKYKFSNFIMGESNRLAHAASIAVAENPSESYNPLFLFSSAGLGKTHLLHSIGNKIKENDPATRVLYVTSENFTNEFINAIKSGNNNSFREKFRNIDVLMVDDIQFIGGKEGTQEEFFHTFNHLLNNNKQIILSSDRPPKDISTLEERLRTRFEAGLMCDIKPPDLEMRIAILKKKTEDENISIEDEVILYIASKIKSNIRELEGIFNRLVAMAKLSKKDINREAAEEVVKLIITENKKFRPGIETLIVETAGYYNLDPKLLTSQTRKQEIVKARQVAMYLAREVLEITLPKIGEEFGGRDHSTVMHSIAKIKGEMEKDQYTRTIIKEITETLKEQMS
jgi:chromosomal replication initiator protein